MASRHLRSAFTLVELLVVIGLIAFLVALLMPVLGRVRDSANQMRCTSNLNQLGVAMLMYAADNDKMFPFAAPLDNSPVGDLPEDYIFWHATPTEGFSDRINHSSIARYLDMRNEKLQSIFRCPSDTTASEREGTGYPYSYSMNFYLDPRPERHSPDGVARLTNLMAIQHAAGKILMVEENEVTINDGYWVPGCCGATWSYNWDFLSIRHDSKNLEFNVSPNGQIPYPSRKGNVLFVDGHVDLVPRDFAHTPQHTLPEK